MRSRTGGSNSSPWQRVLLSSKNVDSAIGWPVLLSATTWSILYNLVRYQKQYVINQLCDEQMYLNRNLNLMLYTRIWVRLLFELLVYRVRRLNPVQNLKGQWKYCRPRSICVSFILKREHLHTTFKHKSSINENKLVKSQFGNFGIFTINTSSSCDPCSSHMSPEWLPVQTASVCTECYLNTECYIFQIKGPSISVIISVSIWHLFIAHTKYLGCLLHRGRCH